MTSDDDERDQPQHRLDRQRERLAVDEDRAAGEIAESRRLQREKRAVQHQERDDGEDA